MKYRIITLLCFTILLSRYSFAGNIVIADKEQKAPIPSAVVLVCGTDSKAPVKLESDDAGIVNIPENAFRLIVRKFGYDERKISKFSYSEGDTIFLKLGYVLHEVAISAIRNNFHVKSDRYIYDVASDSALIGKSTFEVLGRIPILNVTLDGKISSMQGKNLVYKINGLTDPLLSGDLETALRSLKADYVKQIELRTNPNGNSPNTLEINIVTKGLLEGYQVSATSRLNDYSWRNVLWGLTKINKFCVSGSYFLYVEP